MTSIAKRVGPFVAIRRLGVPKNNSSGESSVRIWNVDKAFGVFAVAAKLLGLSRRLLIVHSGTVKKVVERRVNDSF